MAFQSRGKLHTTNPAARVGDLCKICNDKILIKLPYSYMYIYKCQVTGSLS